MLQRSCCGIFLALLLLTHTVTIAQKKWPATLLWRISGNGLDHPSYLYGTMHLQDRRLFQFGDSLYHSLENVEGFALEIDFRDFIDSLFTKQFQDAEDAILDKQEVKIDTKLDKSADSVLKKLGMRKDRLTKKDLKKIRDYRLNNLVQKGEMPTIVDGFLYGLALRQHKWMGGIEDVSDQMHLVDELGSELSPENVFQPEAKLRLAMEEMIRLYTSQDLDGIDAFSNASFRNNMRDQVLIRRNVKMARRMDSLSAIRTMFFAVGAAHLPGDSGVISLLRSRGFTVEPVFSTQKISGEEYARKLNNIPWTKIENEDHLYSVEMPGVPSDYNLLGQALKMKIFFDLTTMTFYMTGNGIGRIKSFSEADKLLRDMANRMGVIQNKLKVAQISRGDISGAEGSFEGPDGAYKVQLLQKKNSLFLLMAGSQKKNNLSLPDIDKFFSSFAAAELSDEKREWKSFAVPEKAFSVLLPGQPKQNKAIDKQSDESSWRFSTYDYVDNERGLYYLVQVRDLREGYYLQSDSILFEDYRQDFEKRLGKLLQAERTVYQGFPAFYFTAVSEKENVLYKTFHVVRGGRVYALIAGGRNDGDLSDIDRFFRSLSLQDYPGLQWKTHAGEGFYTTAPGIITKAPRSKIDSTNTETRLHFISYDSTRAASFEVFKEVMSPFYWRKNDSSFFKAEAKAYESVDDSVIKKEMRWNGGLKSLDMMIASKKSNNIKQVRLMINGDTLITLLTFFPSSYINSGTHQKFFDDFRVSREVSPTIYTSKLKEILHALASTDSSQAAKAMEALSAASFEKSDLSALQDGLLENYSSAEGGEDPYSLIVNAIVGLDDAATLEFIRQHYSQLTGEKEARKYSLLHVLSRIKTQASYDLLKSLLVKDPPKKGDASWMAYPLTDSLKLTASLYPELLSLSDDPLFADELAGVTKTLLDSNMIAKEAVLPFKDRLLSTAASRLPLALKDTATEWWKYLNWVDLIGTFNDAPSNALLQQYLKTEIVGLKKAAIVSLARNDQPVDKSQMEIVAGDRNFRLSLYDDLKELKKEHLFPAKYANQKTLAEADLFQAVDEDYEIEDITWLAEKTVDFMGKKQKFQLFKVNIKGEDGSESYLGVAGPYVVMGKELVTYADGTGLYWDEAFNKLKIDKQFRAYLQQIEEYMKEENSSK
jgi:uncharacterized protein YbaP (TraB family)